MNLEKKKILVTGGTGFIGSAIVNKLINLGCSVNIISMPNDPLWKIEDISQCKFYSEDLRDLEKAEKLMEKIQPEIIFHLAGIINTNLNKNAINQNYSLNLDVTKNTLIALNEYNYDLFINIGSGNEYGDINPPFKESDRERPISPYSASKIAATFFCEMVSNVYKKSIITVRPFLIYGPKQISDSLIPSLIYYGIEKKPLSLTKCEQVRDFVYIDDVADAFVYLAQNVDKIKKMGIFNVGSGIGLKIIEVVNLIKQKIKDTKYLIGAKPYRPGETMNHYASIEKIKNAINWTPKWNLEAGIDSTIKWWKNNRDIWIKNKNIWEN